VNWFERLTRADVASLGELYAANAYIRDPFNEVRGVPAIRKIFETCSSASPTAASR
jgi:hypothetical protein